MVREGYICLEFRLACHEKFGPGPESVLLDQNWLP